MQWFSLSNDIFLSQLMTGKHSCNLYPARFCEVFKKGCNRSSDYSFNEVFGGSFEHQLGVSSVTKCDQGVMAEPL